MSTKAAPSTIREKDAAPQKRGYSAPALEKGLDILELLARKENGCTQTEITEALNRNLNEVFHTLICLCNRGYVVSDTDSERYSLSLKMFEMSHLYPPVKRLVSSAISHMNELTHSLQQSCHLVVLWDDRLVVVAQVESPSNLNFSVRMGTPVPPLSSTSGRVILAFSQALQRERILNIAKRLEPEHFPVKADDLAFTRITSQGYMEQPSREIRGIINISTPILDYTGSAIAALTVPFVDRIGDSEIKNSAQCRDELLRAANRISLAIGAGASRQT